ncbi:ABC transporter substrate-binding protein [soil metagenome]
MSKIGKIVSVAAATLVLTGVSASAQELKIGLKTEPSSLDPQYHALNPNLQAAFHVFDTLVMQDENLKPQPGLAVSWKPISDTVWEFKLRPGVKFHDGSDVTAEDVVFTLQRPPKVPNSPGPYTVYTRQMKSFEIVDPLTIRIHTDGPAPLLPLNLAALPIMSHTAAAGPAPEGKTSAELNAGNGLVGTGPFKFVEWQRGNRLVYERNDNYWGEKPAWQKLTLRPLSNNTARVAALLSGDVDLIEDPPTTDLAKLKSDPKITLSQATSNRVIYVALDQHGDPPIGIPDTNGKNPLMDKRVRQALSMAIDRKGIVDKIMEGVALPAGDFLPFPMGGTAKDTPIDKFDSAAAKKLLAEAGYPNGFAITLGAPNGRYINDLKVAQAIAAMWSRIGVKTEVDAVAPPVFFKNRDGFKYSAYMAGWGAVTGEIGNALQSLVTTPDKVKGMGTTNSGRYSNPALDAKFEEAMRTVDDGKREALLRDASKIVIQDDHGFLPIHFEVSVWAMRKGLTYVGRADQSTLAVNVRPAK